MAVSHQVAPTRSVDIEPRACATAEYYVPGDTVCQPCPEGAHCQGRALEDITTRDNFWRCDRRTATFVRCPAFLPDKTCMAGDLQGACAPNHKGPMCAACASGFVGPGCEACTGFHVATLFAFGALYGLVFVWTLVRAFVQDPQSRRLLTISVWKRIIGFFQTLYCLQPVFVPLERLHTAYAAVGSIVSLSVPATALQCAFGLSYYRQFALYMLLPSVSGAIAAFALLYDRTLGLRPWLRRLPEADKAVRRARLVTRGRTFRQLAVISVSVVVLLLYPTLTRRATAMNRCDEYILDQGGWSQSDDCRRLRLLRADHSVDCDKPEHAHMRVLSVAAFLLYGLGIPTGLVLTGTLLRWCATCPLATCAGTRTHTRTRRHIDTHTHTQTYARAHTHNDI